MRVNRGGPGPECRHAPALGDNFQAPVRQRPSLGGVQDALP
jgi:hypothetical protein